MKLEVPDGLDRDEMTNAIYDFERSGQVRTGDIDEQQEVALMLRMERNFRLCLILTALFGVAFLYSLFGMWRP